MNCLVTIGIPFFNAEDFLADAIRSVINQSDGRWKLILVDDGSTDSSLQIARSFKNKNIEVISDGNKRGLSYRLNEIALLSNTKYLARMDADDIMHPQRLEKQIEFLENNSQTDVVGTKVVSIDKNNVPYGHRGNVEIPKNISEVLKLSVFNHATVMGKTEWFLTNKYSDKYGVLVNGVYNRLEDYELWYRTIKSSNFYVLNDWLLFYREINIPFLDKYIKTNISLREFLKDNRDAIGLSLTRSLILKSYIKDNIYRIFSLFNSEDLLIKKRSVKLTPEEVEAQIKIIKKAVQK